jgi:hypothetical protein
MYRKIVMDLFTCQEARSNVLLSWLTESHDNVVENILSTDYLTYHEAMEHILYLPSNHHSPCGASYNNTKPQYEPNDIFLSNGN